ncbi:hypothetical protein DF110_06010 [Burkholderia stagnalis]|nr:hypothetical protein DF110_06010 [Burkholderia stagnalis]
MKRSVCYYASGVVGGAIAVAGYRYVNWGDLKAADWAAWVQAVGSVVAIMGAVWATKSQTKVAIDAVVTQHKLEREERRKAAKAIVEAAMLRASEIRKQFTSANRADEVQTLIRKSYDKTILDGLVHAMYGIPVHELGSSVAVTELLLLRDQFVFLAGAIQRFMSESALTGSYESMLKQAYEDVKSTSKLTDELTDRGNGHSQGTVGTHLNEIDRRGNAFLLALSETD